MTDINPKLSMKTFNVNRLINQIKIQRLSDWIKNKMQLYAVYKRHTLHSKIQISLKKRYKHL